MFIGTLINFLIQHIFYHPSINWDFFLTFNFSQQVKHADDSSEKPVTVYGTHNSVEVINNDDIITSDFETPNQEDDIVTSDFETPNGEDIIIVTSDFETPNREDDIVTRDFETMNQEDKLVPSDFETRNQEIDTVTDDYHSLNQQNDIVNSDFDTMIQKGEIFKSGFESPSQESDIVTSHSLTSLRKTKASGKQKQTKVSLSGRTKEGLDNDRFEKRTRCETGKKKECSTSIRTEGRLVIRKKTRRYNTSANHQRSLRKRVFNVLKQKQEEQGSGNSTELTSKANILNFNPFSCPIISKQGPSSKLRDETKISYTIDRKTGNNLFINIRCESVCECHFQAGLSMGG